MVDIEQPLGDEHIAHLKRRLPKATIERHLEETIRELVESGTPMQIAVDVFKKKYIDVGLSLNRHNVTKTAAALGVHRNTLTNNRTPTPRVLWIRQLRAKRKRNARRR